jgi:serine/threonine protein kinase
MGTVAYMSPEQIKAESVGSASDIFLLGAIFYDWRPSTASVQSRF